MPNYDIIGDIHGHGDELEALLRKLGYRRTQSCWVAPANHMAVFVGDLIDRGPRQIETVDIVRRMVDAGYARCILGNHEYNAIAYTVRSLDEPHRFLREHSPNKIKQHAAFLKQVGANSAAHNDLVAWFRTLPPTLDLGSIRVAHAYWNDAHVAHIRHRLAARPMDDAFLQEACTRDTETWHAMEAITKGVEMPLPRSASFTDKDSVVRTDVRVRWWDTSAATYRAYAVIDEDQRHRIPDVALPAEHRHASLSATPTFVGHYWMRGAPQVQSPTVACVDYSVTKDGCLVAYRWQGESALSNDHFVVVGG